MPPNPAEQFVFDICRRSFLSMWSYANPLGASAGKELCDVLVICDPDVIIFSVKEVSVSSTADDATKFERWARKAVEASARQIYGAERWIATSGKTHVIRHDGTSGVPFPASDRRRIHRVAIALGAEKHFPIPFGDFGKGFVHVFDERACAVLLSELDTVRDFVDYLTAKESFVSSHDVFCEGEENLLAVYLHRGRAFPKVDQPILIENDSWQQLLAKPEFQSRTIEDEASLVWDELIEFVAKDVLKGNLERPVTLSDAEKALRVMARETRFSRRMLGKRFREFLYLAAEEKIESRMIRSLSNTGYVFVVCDNSETDRDYRNGVLGLRCLVARTDMRDCETIIGIGTERPPAKGGFSFDIVYMHQPNWSAEDIRRSEEIRAEFGYFRAPIETKIHEDEYPGT